VAVERGEKGEKGDRGERGPARRLAVVGYLILTLTTAAAFFATWHNEKAIQRARIERIHQLNQINREQCASLSNLYAVIRQTLVESDRRIDTIAYYRSHPAERRRAHRANVAILTKFRTPPCPKRIAVPAD
jgi:hypothetical protein